MSPLHQLGRARWSLLHGMDKVAEKALDLGLVISEEASPGKAVGSLLAIVLFLFFHPPIAFFGRGSVAPASRRWKQKACWSAQRRFDFGQKLVYPEQRNEQANKGSHLTNVGRFSHLSARTPGTERGTLSPSFINEIPGIQLTPVVLELLFVSGFEFPSDFSCCPVTPTGMPATHDENYRMFTFPSRKGSCCYTPPGSRPYRWRSDGQGQGGAGGLFTESARV